MSVMTRPEFEIISLVPAPPGIKFKVVYPPQGPGEPVDHLIYDVLCFALYTSETQRAGNLGPMIAPVVNHIDYGLMCVEDPLFRDSDVSAQMMDACSEWRHA